jgi:NADPH2:quinone reductase
VLRLTGGVGVQVVYDGTGAESFQDSLKVVDFHGTLALYGPLFDQTIAPFSPWSLPKSVKITYPVFLHHIRTRERLLKYSTQLFDWVRAGKLKINVGHRYRLSDAAKAHSDLHSRRTAGKLLLLP